MSFKLSQQALPRSSMMWLLAGYIINASAHLYAYIPMWIVLLMLMCFVWRMQIYRMKWRYPSSFNVILIIALVVFGVYSTQEKLLSTTGFCILFMCLYSLKFIESKTLRDGQVIVLVSYLATALIFLFETNIAVFIYAMAAILVNTCALMGLQQTHRSPYNTMDMLKANSKLLALSVPLMVILFVGFPRFPAFISLPQANSMEQQNSTGISDNMTPGSITDLVQSNELMFWAEFSKQAPKQNQLYWRVLTLDHFDGKTWSQRNLFQFNAPEYTVNPSVNVQNYNIIFEPTQKKYLASLDISEFPFQAPRSMTFLNDYRLESRQNVYHKIRYDLKYFPSNTKGLKLPPRGPEIRQYTQLPKKSNPRIRQWILQNHPDAKQNPEAFANAILLYFRQNNFYYTLSPPLLENETVDSFFFDSRQGFCEHYASTLAFMLREAGIPSRIVTGFLGGKVSSDNQQVQVRSLDAHAWVEYWVEGKGWIRIDPTAAVAPERVESGIESVLNDKDNNTIFGESNTFLAPIIMQWRQTKAEMNYQWDKRVLGYQSDNQQDIFTRLFGNNQRWRMQIMQYTFLSIIAILLLSLLIYTKPWQRYRFGLANVFQNSLDLLNHQYPQLQLSISNTPQEVCQISQPHLNDTEYQALKQLMNAIETPLYHTDKKPDKKRIQHAYQSLQKTLRKQRHSKSH